MISESVSSSQFIIQDANNAKGQNRNINQNRQVNEESKSLVPIKNESGSSIEGPNNSHSSQQERQDSGQFYNISI